MSSRRAFVVAAAVWALSIGLMLVGPIAEGLTKGTGSLTSGQAGSLGPTIATLLFVLSFATVGALLGWKRPSNPIGWLLAFVALTYALGGFTEYIKVHGWTDWLGSWIWGLGTGVAGTFVLLLFPDGHLLSRRWRPVAWFAGIGLGSFVVGNMLAPGVIAGSRSVNPIGVHALGALWRVMRGGFGLVAIAAVAAIVSVAVRYRRSRDLEREQMKWLLYAGAIILLAVVAQFPIFAWLGSGDLGTNVNNTVGSASLVLVPIAIGIAVLRYRLYDIDVVINRTVVYGLLAAFITAVYVAIVVGIGAALGRGSSRPNLALSILATAVVAVAFQPVRDRVQRLANRLVYGVRATPYEVLAGFVQQVGGTYAAEDVLPRMARALGEGAGAAGAAVWLAVGGELRREACWPPGDDDGRRRLPVHDGDLPSIEGSSLALPVRDRGELLGALSLTKRVGEALTGTEEKLARDLASQAGLVLRNVVLTEELLDSVRDIETSRARIVTAEEQERGRIERLIEEGTKRDLHATADDLDAAISLVATDPAAAAASLASVSERATRALESLRDVARGIYPPLLADKGLVAALTAQASRSRIPVEVAADGVGRLSEEVESTVYFACLEALRAGTAGSGSSSGSISLHVHDEELRFEVGVSGPQGPNEPLRPEALVDARDRAAALGGDLTWTSSPGVLAVRGRVPVTSRRQALEPVG